MTLGNIGKRLLNDILSESFKSPDGVNALRFRVDNEEYLPEIDKLESLGYVERKKDHYFIKPLALAQLAKENTDARNMINTCNLVFALLRGLYKDNPGQQITIPNISKNTSLSEDDVMVALRIITQTPIVGRYSIYQNRTSSFVAPSENILKYKSFEDILHESLEYPIEQKTLLSTAKANWTDIESEFGIAKTSFGKKINFVSDPFKRAIIFRDVEQAFILASLGFSKSAVILAGGVIEELLRLYLEFKGFKPIKNDFDGYIQTCEQEGLLKAGISRLSDSARHFRNLVHLEKEETKRHTISKSTAKTAVASIFTIANDF